MSRRSPRLNDPVNVPVPNDPVNDSTPEGSQIPPPQASVQHLVNNDPANNSLAGQTSTSSSTPPQETTGNTNASPATYPTGQTSTSSSTPPQETAGNTNPILPATVNLPHTSITATSPAVVPPNPAVGPPTDTASGDQPTGSGSSSPRVNLVDYTSYYHHYEDTSRYHNSDNDWYYSHGWKKKGTRSDVKKIYNDVAWMKHVLGQPWKGSGDSCSLLEFRNKLTCSAEYKWADPCSRYFILKHNLSESIQRLLDGYEADNEVDMARFSDPLGSDSPYWLECSEQVWSFLERTYAGLDGDRLEERWSSQWLSKGSTWLEFYSTFDSVGRQLAKSRGIERLSDQEQRCRLYQALPHACQVYLNERGYRQVGSMPFPKMIECVQAWCETHWDHKQVKVTALSTDTKERWNGYDDRSNYSRDVGGNNSTGALPEKRGYRKFPPRSQRLREDAKILADDYNKSVLAAKCGRCLSSEGGHTAISCCQQLDRPEIRCPFCGLKHSDCQLCPQDFDTYGKDCGRCGRRHHGPWACKAPTPSSRVISAVSLSPMSVEDPVLTVTLGRSTTPYQALVDTGAQISVLSSSVLKDLGLVDLQPTPLTLTTADWSRPSVKGIIKNLPVYLPQGRVVYLDFLVSAQDLTRQVILSASFLRELDAVWLVGKSRLIFEAGANGITQQLYNLGRPTSSSKPVDPALQGVVELCNLALSTAAESTSTPVLPDDLATDIVTSQFPSDQSKELTAGAVVPSVIPTHEGHDSDDFIWDLAPPTPRSKLGRFVLHVPWKGDARPTGGYNSTAARRAFSTDARLSASERSDYLEVVRGLVEEGFVVPADEDVVSYLPCFPVIRKQAKSTKVRLVVDPSEVLNDLCRTGGPPSDKYFPTTLLWNLHMMRTGKYVVFGDLTKAFHCIALRHEDTRYFGMYIAVGSQLSPVRWVVMNFGGNFAPSALVQSLQSSVVFMDYDDGFITREEAVNFDSVVSQLIDCYDGLKIALHKTLGPDDSHKSTAATDYQEPVSSHVGIYVDDTHARGETKEEALYYADRLDSGLASHGFGSNAIKRLLSWAHDPSTYLGYLYSHDSLSVIFEPAEGLLSSKGLSRRQCFKIAMAFYDPLGLGVEYAVALRAMVREACSSSVGWDDLVESSLAAKLVTLAIGIKTSAPTTTSRPRHVDLSVIHCFCDASGDASSVSFYDASFNRIYAMSHLWTVAQQRWSIPKKECVSLCDAVHLVSEYVTQVAKLSRRDLSTVVQKVYFYTDSEVSIYRLRRKASGLRLKLITPLESRRLQDTAEVLRKLVESKVDLRVLHVPGTLNPADAGSRPLTSGELPVIPSPDEVKEASKAAVIGDFTYVPTSTSPLSPTDQPAEDDSRVCAPIEVDTRNSDPRVQDLANFFDEPTIKDLQQRHLKTRAIIAALRAGPGNEKAPNLRCYRLVDGVLHYTGVTSLVNDRTRAEVSLPVLPVCKEVLTLLRDLHHSLGHVSASKVLSLYQTHYYTPKIRSHLRRLVAHCRPCQLSRCRRAYRSKNAVTRPVGMSFDVGQVRVVDYQGPLYDRGEKRWVLTLLDPVSFNLDYRVVDAPNIDNTLDALSHNFATMGTPSVLVSDPGVAFTSEKYLSFCRKWSVANCWLPREARSYGGFHERFHGLLLQQIRCRLREEEGNPDPTPLATIVADSVGALNKIPLDSLGGLSAHELHFCRRPRYPGAPSSDTNYQVTIDKLQQWLPSVSLTDPQKEYLREDLRTMADEVAARRCDSMKDFWLLWLERSDRIRQRVSKLPMPRSQRLHHQVGDLVWRFRRGSMKQASSWIGPYRVTAASDAGTVYYLSTPEGKPLRYSETFFNLKPYVPSEDFIDSYQESEAADDDILMADPHEVAENMVNPDAVIDEAPSVPAAPGGDVAQELTDDIIIQDLLDEHLLAEIRGAEDYDN